MEKELKYGVQSADLDSVLMQETDGDNINENESNSTETVCDGIWNNKSTRLQVARSVCVSAAYMMSGWTKGQIGPAFPDIMMISGADLEKGSVFMTSLYTGQLLGSILGGFIFPKMNKYILFASALVLYGLTVAAIPWCFLYELMVAAFAFLGVCGGINSVGVGVECVAIWGPTPRGRSFIMANSAAYTIASVVAPLVTAPFLLKQSVHSFTNTNTSSWNITLATPIWINGTTQSSLNDMEISIDNSTWTNGSDSKLYIAYTISAVFCLLTALLFFILFFQPGQPVTIQKQDSGKLEFFGKRSFLIKWLQLFNIGIFSVVQNAIDFTFIGYLATFCINYLGWTKTLGATVTSLAFFTRLLGTISGIFLVRYVKLHYILLCSTMLSTAGFIALTISAHLYFDVGVWISVCVVGIPFGLMWPNMISWINENLVPVRSVTSSFLSFTACLGALLAPLLLGYLMEEVSLLWFCYLFCLKSIVIAGNSILMFLYTVPK